MRAYLVIAPSLPLAGLLVRLRLIRCRYSGRIRFAQDAPVGLGICQRAGRYRRFRFRPGFYKGARLRPLENRINNKSRRSGNTIF